MSGDWCQADKDRLYLRPVWGSSSLGLDWRWRWGSPASQPCQLATEQRQTIATGDQGSFVVAPRTTAHQDMGVAPGFRTLGSNTSLFLVICCY